MLSRLMLSRIPRAVSCPGSQLALDTVSELPTYRIVSPIGKPVSRHDFNQLVSSLANSYLIVNRFPEVPTIRLSGFPYF